jgi:hypothetical protein
MHSQPPRNFNDLRFTVAGESVRVGLTGRDNGRFKAAAFKNGVSA